MKIKQGENVMGDMDNLAHYPGWETVRKIGTGSFGTVYEIERDLFGKKEKAALKLISIPQNESDIDELYGNGFDDASITAHFQHYLADIVREYSLMAEMKGHTNVVYCDDIRYVQHDDGFGWDIYIKMELLTPMMKALGKEVTDEQVIKLGRDICNALVLCKSRNIIHRDIKPQNIFISNDGDYKLGDFGIAKTAEKTSGGTKIGTYNYMAPEVYNNEPYGHAADIYSLGLVMYWLLNGRRMPFNPLPPAVPTASEMDEARLRRFQGEPIPAPAHGSEELKQIVLKACAYDPKDRYQSAAEMRSALESIGKPVEQVVIPPVVVVEDDETIAVNPAEETPTDEGTLGVWSDDQDQPEPVDAEGEEEKTVGWANGKKNASDGAAEKAAEGESGESSPVKETTGRKGKKKWVGIAAAVLLLTAISGAAVVLAKTNVSEIMPDESALKALLYEDYSAIGYFDVKTTLKLSDSKKISFPVGNVYDGNTVIITSKNGGQTETQEVVAENGNVEATVNPEGKYLLQIKTDALPEDTWTEWSTELPDAALLNSGAVETDLLYRVKEHREYNKEELEGWELYDTVPNEEPYGEWSEWTEEQIEESADIEIEQQQIYRYRNKETTTSSSATLDGWTQYGSEDKYSYGEWSDWSETPISSSSTLDVEIKTQYRHIEYGWVEEDGELPERVLIAVSEWSDEPPLIHSGNPDYQQETRTVYRSRTKTLAPTTYYYERWSDWSSWSTEKPESAEEVEEKTQYRSRDIYGDTKYLFWRWSDWRLEQPVASEADASEMETRVMYRFAR